MQAGIITLVDVAAGTTTYSNQGDAYNDWRVALLLLVLLVVQTTEADNGPQLQRSGLLTAGAGDGLLKT